MQVYIKDKCWKTIINYAKCAYDTFKTEIGGMSVALEDDNGDWWIEDPLIMKQEVSSGLCVLDKTELAEYYGKMAIKYKKKNMRFCWWHSHHTMAAFWSGTDLEAIDEYSDGDLSFALVVNLKEEYKCRVSVWKPIEMHKDVVLNIVQQNDKKLPKKIIDNVSKYCTKPESNIKKYAGNVKNLSQLSLMKDDEEVFEQSFENCLEKVDEIHGQMISGEINYADYSKMITKINDDLLKERIGLKVRLLSKNQIEDIFTVSPYELIEVTDPLYKDTYYGGWNYGW